MKAGGRAGRPGAGCATSASVSDPVIDPAPLFQSLPMGRGRTAPNRLAVAPMTNLQSDAAGLLTEVEIEWLARRAEGGFGLIETAAAYVNLDGKGWAGQVGIDREACVPGLARMANRLRVGGGLGVVQLFHGGVRAPSKVTGQQPWSASEFQEAGKSFEVPRPASDDDLARVIDDFAAAAVRAERAGFEGVEIHGAHGYLPSQFLSAAMNQRTDGWGGDLSGRARLLRTITQRVRAAVGGSTLVGVRLSPEDFGYARGLDLDDSLQVAAWLVADGIDFLHLSLWDVTQPTRKRPEAHPTALFRAAVGPTVPILVAGAVWSPAEALACLDRGADMVALGRAAILNPAWPDQARHPGWQPARPPMSVDDLAARAVSAQFAEYLRRWPGFVA